ncbi:MAG TPA: hypothetical protein H9749_01020 [Candidatus Acutalibacter stercorigallinarum]|nr:hypothetical protein [Candidatus Acutalibacter stercorigallinarum]
MIEILPMADREREKELLAAVEGAGPEARVLAMTDRGEELGTVAVELRDGTLHILQMRAGEYDFSRKPQGEEAFILDTLLRSAASWGENFGAGEIVTAFPDFFDFFKARGFASDDSHAFTPMSTIVRYE